MTQQDRDALGKLTERIANLEIAIKGNGTRGLAERMTDTEIWQKAHEKAHQLFLDDLHKYRGEREKKEAERDRIEAHRYRARTRAIYTFAGTVFVSVGGILLRFLLAGG